MNPVVEVEVAKGDGIEKLRARAKALPDGPERDRLYDYMTEVWPAFADYQKKTERTIPIVVLKPVCGSRITSNSWAKPRSGSVSA